MTKTFLALPFRLRFCPARLVKRGFLIVVEEAPEPVLFEPFLVFAMLFLENLVVFCLLVSLKLWPAFLLTDLIEFEI